MLNFKLGLKPKGKQKKNRIGLDIGTSAVKIVEMSGTYEKPVLAALGLKSAPGSSKSGLADLIKAAAGEAKVSTNQANISVSGPSLIVRFISMPKMKAEDLKNAIRFEAEKFIPFDISECVVDFQILAKTDTENRLNILLVAARREQILERVRSVEQAGFSVGAVDVDGFAISNSFLRNFQSLDPNKTVALLNIGASYTNLSILSGGMIHFARDVAIGSNDFNETIARIFNVTHDAAEGLKVSPGGKSGALAEAAKQVAGSLLDDVKLSFSYHENQSGHSIEEVYLTGGGAALAGLDDVFADAFGAKPVHWDPLAFLEKPARGIDPALLSASKGSFAVAAGLALR